MIELSLLICTGVIAVSTVVYTIFSMKLWMATKNSVDIARYSAFMNYYFTLVGKIEDIREEDPQGAAILEQILSVHAEFGFKHFFKELDLKRDSDMRDMFGSLEGVLIANGIDPKSSPFTKPIVDKMEE